MLKIRVMKFLTKLSSAGLLLLASALHAAGKIEWEPRLDLGPDVFPSLLISTATVDWNENAEEEENSEEAPLIGDPNSWFGVILSNVPKGAKITVEASGDGWVKPSKFEGTVEKRAKELHVNPKMVFDYEKLHTVKQQKPVNLTFKVTVNGESLGEKTETLTMHSVNDCPFLVDNGKDEEPTDLKWMFAAYVNEEHPEIDGILKEALKTGLVDSFTGYQSGSPDVVMTQVFAIWHVLQRRGIKYSDITTNAGSKHVFSQTVRFLDDSIKATQANCVDGSVLMASILRKIGLNVDLVLVPGHCYLAFDLDQKGEMKAGLETTMLGSDNLKPMEQMKKIPEALKKKEFEASLKTFQAAIGVATGDLEKNADKFDADDESALQYQLINIQESRDFGIKPIASGVK